MAKVAKKARERILTFKESELAGLLQDEHARGYKEGHIIGFDAGREHERERQRPITDDLVEAVRRYRLRHRNNLQALRLMLPAVEACVRLLDTEEGASVENGCSAAPRSA